MHSVKPRTAALERALFNVSDVTSIADLLFLEQWEISPLHGLAAARRISQLRRANPELAAAIRLELSSPPNARVCNRKLSNICDRRGTHQNYHLVLTLEPPRSSPTWQEAGLTSLCDEQRLQA